MVSDKKNTAKTAVPFVDYRKARWNNLNTAENDEFYHDNIFGYDLDIFFVSDLPGIKTIRF